MLSSWSSGSSYSNCVELQNSCPAQGHSNIFIPSTLNGVCFNEETGKVDQDKLGVNMESAMDVYIARVSGSPCGDTLIHLYKGADSSEFQCMRKDMQIFLKRSKKKEQLKQKKLAIYSYFQRIWDLKQRHMVIDLPLQYLFISVCCFSKDCPHPRCQNGQSSSEITWFPGGPSITWVPLPVPDLKRPWGVPGL